MNKDYQKLMGEYQRLLGQFIGTLDGITAWDIPQELQIILRKKLKDLELKKAPGGAE